MIPFPEILTLSCIYTGINAFAFILFAYDKKKAQRGSWRVPEGTLLLLALFGPFGAYGAMRSFRHKTRKGKFFLVPVFLLLHVIIIILLIASSMDPGLISGFGKIV